jgi:hypothetical protein
MCARSRCVIVYHRQAERGHVSRYFANYASRLITLAMAPLALALSLEVAFIVLGSVAASSVIGTGLMLFLVWYWYVFPAYRQVQQRHP